MPMPFFTDTPRYAGQMNSPLGQLLLIAGEQALCELRLPANAHTLPPGVSLHETPLLTLAKRQLAEYFAGQRRQFALPLAPAGTAFSQACWQALLRVGYGRVISYGEQATLVGCRSARAVGQANSRNPLPVIIPCHRVLARGGGLGGYSGGLAVKEYLLRLEGAL